MKEGKDFRTEIYFVRGKMKKRMIPLNDGLPVDEFIRRNADDVYLMQEGHWDILHEREMQRAIQSPVHNAGTRPSCHQPFCPRVARL